MQKKRAISAWPLLRYECVKLAFFLVPHLSVTHPGCIDFNWSHDTLSCVLMNDEFCVSVMIW